MPPDLSFLPKAQRDTAWMLLAALALIGAGWKLRDLIGDAKAAEARVSKLEATVARVDRNQARIMEHFNIKGEVAPSEYPTIGASGVAP